MGKDINHHASHTRLNHGFCHREVIDLLLTTLDVSRMAG